MNSFRCLYVSCFSARKAGPISKTLSIPPRTVNCLYNCGLCDRKAGVSKYIIGNKLVPPSEAEAIIFGELISLNPSVIKCSLPYCRTLALRVNIALTCALLKSKNRLSRRVSRPIETVSVTPRGRGVSACASTTNLDATTS